MRVCIYRVLISESSFSSFSSKEQLLIYNKLLSSKVYKPYTITGKLFNPFVHFISNTSKTKERYDNLYHIKTNEFM